MKKKTEKAPETKYQIWNEYIGSGSDANHHITEFWKNLSAPEALDKAAEVLDVLLVDGKAVPPRKKTLEKNLGQYMTADEIERELERLKAGYGVFKKVEKLVKTGKCGKKSIECMGVDFKHRDGETITVCVDRDD